MDTQPLDLTAIRAKLAGADPATMTPSEVGWFVACEQLIAEIDRLTPAPKAPPPTLDLPTPPAGWRWLRVSGGVVHHLVRFDTILGESRTIRKCVRGSERWRAMHSNTCASSRPCPACVAMAKE